jgi:hypothetical protein
MYDYRNESRANTRRENGAILPFVMVSLLALFAFAAWSTETGRVWQTKSQLQAAADAAALAGAGSLLSADFTSVDEGSARTAAMAYGAQHVALGSNLTIAAVDVEAGSWDMASQTFTALPGNTNPDVMRSVRVTARRDENVNGPIDTVLGRILGINSISVDTDAVAEWGFAGSGAAGIVSLPIAIDCCAVTGPACDQNYCDSISNSPPNPCLLSNGETTSCLEFFSTPEQNACWTAFQTDSSAVSVPLMTDIIADGNPEEIGGDPIYLDNGTKTPVVQDIKDKFDADGTDTNGDGIVDSWIVTLPIVECQNPGDQCATGNTQDIVGFLCMDIREVIVTPDKIIKGDFLCSTDPRCDMPGFGPGGPLIGTISADFPVIVN